MLGQNGAYGGASASPGGIGGDGANGGDAGDGGNGGIGGGAGSASGGAIFTSSTGQLLRESGLSLASSTVAAGAPGGPGPAGTAGDGGLGGHGGSGATNGNNGAPGANGAAGLTGIAGSKGSAAGPGISGPFTSVGELSIKTTSLPKATKGAAYAATISGSGGRAPYAWAAYGLPAGIRLNASDGKLSGTPLGAGSYGVVVLMTDASSPRESASRTLTLTVAS
jgi:hypothetical protein